MSKKHVKVVRKLSNLLSRFADKFDNVKSKNDIMVNSGIVSTLVKKGDDRDLYKTPYGDQFWLNNESCIDDAIKKYGVWEPDTTLAIKLLVKEGDYVLDIGANIGYDTVIISKLVGTKGKVFAFEPTKYFSKALRENIAINNLTNCEVLQYGLSNKKEVVQIQIEDSTATLHVPDNGTLARAEKIELNTLKNFIKENNIKKINFIKLDVDGHEPLILESAWDILDKFKPLVLLEISHLHYLEAGFNAWDFYDDLKKRGYYIYNEVGIEEIRTRKDFLIQCGNFNFSANIIISKSPIVRNK